MIFRNDIQGLRALAVLFVFIFHLSTRYLPGGFIGVDIFFVVSGYLISNIVVQKLNANKFNIWDFYVGRVKRIVPAYYIMLLIAWIVFLFIFSNADSHHFKMSHFWAAVFNSNNYFSKIDDYFGAKSSENPLLHTWTLAVEMQFYLFLPIMLIVIRNRKLLVTSVLAMALILVSYASYEIMHGNKVGMYFSLLSRAPEFLIGVLASLIRIEEKSFFIKNSTLIGMLGLLGLFSSAFFLNELSDFPGVYALVPCISTVLILATPSGRVNKFLSTSVFIFIGEISYSVYLWHWPIMAFVRYYNFRYEFTITETILVVCLTAIAAIVSYYLVEKPKRIQKRYRFAVPLVIIGTLNISMIYFTRPMKNALSEMPTEFLSLTFGMESNSNKFKGVGVYGGSSIHNKRILLLGDSHAHGFKPYLDVLGKKKAFPSGA